MNRSGTKIKKYGIEFDSLLELDFYEGFLKRDKKLDRGTPIAIIDGFKSKVKCFTNDTDSGAFKVVSPTIRKIEYTPDFVYYYPNGKAYIEVKGFPNETFRYRWKLFKKYIEEHEPDSIIFLIKRKHNGRVKLKDNMARIEETESIVSDILKIIQNNE